MVRAARRHFRSLTVAACLASSAAGPAGGGENKLPPADTTDEIVVLARRSGAPVWRVNGAGQSIVLIGVIQEVSKDTHWSPKSLDLALSRADRLTFPDTQDVSVSVFAMVGLALKFRRHSTLPEGRSLDQMLNRDQLARLSALRDRGLIGRDFAGKHPFHLALALQDKMKGRGFGPDPSDVARKLAKRAKIEMVPLGKVKAKPLLDELFRSRPEVHIPCLMASVSLAEAGPAAVRERSDAWANQRVVASLKSVAEGVHAACWPNGSAFDVTPERGLHEAIARLLDDRRVTVAMVSLPALARPDAVLDRLKSRGFEISGPAWR